MDEKIVEAQFRKNTLAWIIIIASLVSILIGCIITYHDYRNGTSFYAANDGIFYRDDRESGFYPNSEIYDSFGEYYADHSWPFDNFHLFWIYGGIAGILFGLFMFWLMSACKMTITDSRVIGKASFQQRIDLPISQISSIGLGSFESIMVATSSGKMRFWLLSNRNEVHTELTKIIGKVQAERGNTNKNIYVQSNADELKKYKELLDSGVITQEEFDAKKKQLLGL